MFMQVTPMHYLLPNKQYKIINIDLCNIVCTVTSCLELLLCFSA